MKTKDPNKALKSSLIVSESIAKKRKSKKNDKTLYLQKAYLAKEVK